MAKVFKKYKISIIRVDTVDYQRNTWNKVADTGNPKDNGPVYEYVKESFSREDESNVMILELENEGMDVKKIVSSILGA